MEAFKSWIGINTNDDEFNLVVQTPFGLAGNGANTIYVSDWDTNNITEINIESMVTKPIVSGESPMGLLYTAVSVGEYRTTKFIGSVESNVSLPSLSGCC
jgi:hypothetical protein